MLIKSDTYVILLLACLSSYVYAAPRAHLCEPSAPTCTSTVNFERTEIKKISSPKIVVLSNTGDAVLNITDMEISGEFSLGETYACYNKGSNCSTKPDLPCKAIGAGEGCTFNVWYTPVTDPGKDQAELTSTVGALKFTADIASNNRTIALIGTTDNRTCTKNAADPRVFAETALGSPSATQTFNIEPTNVARTIEIFTTGEFSKTDTCQGNTLPANETCTITVSFTPAVKDLRYGQLFYNRTARACGFADHNLRGNATGTNQKPPASSATPLNTTPPAKADDGSSGDKTTDIKGCTLGKNGPFDPVLALLVLAAALGLYRRRMNK